MMPTLALALLGSLLGCGSLQPAEPEMDLRIYGWLSEVAWQPEAFEALTADDASRAGWIALHSHRYAEAYEAFPEDHPGRARAAWQLGALHDDLSRLSGILHDTLFTTWAERGLPDPSAAVVVAGLAARCTGHGDLQRWTTLAEPLAGAELFDPEVALWEVKLASDHPWWPALARHRAAHDGEPGALARRPTPVITEPADGFSRTFHDPCIHRTLSDVWTERVGENPLATAMTWADSLEGRLFSPWLGPEDLRISESLIAQAPPIPFAHLGQGSVSLAGLPSPEVGDEVQDARESVRALDALLEGWHQTLIQKASPDGRALLRDLGLVSRLRQEHLVVRGRAALVADRPHHALALLQMARDASAREIGPPNSPQLFALIAEAEVRIGRTREALDTLHLLAAAHPEVHALEEVAGDLAVLQGLDRRGDSREQ